MRAVLVAAILAGLTSLAHAERAVDITTVWGAAGGEYSTEAPGSRVPPNPSLLVRLGSNGPQGIPLFEKPDGTPIPITSVITILWDDGPLLRVVLDVADGMIEVRLPGDAEPIATYMIDPSFVPKTRSVEVRPAGGSLRVDSDAIAFVILDRRSSHVQFNNGHVLLDVGQRERVLAYYPTGLQEVIYEGELPQPAPANIDLLRVPAPPETRGRGGWWLVILAWSLLAVVAFARTKMPPGD